MGGRKEKERKEKKIFTVLGKSKSKEVMAYIGCAGKKII